MKATPSMAIAMYKPKDGNAENLMEILKDHVPSLRVYGLITDSSAYMVKAADGTVIEVFEWVNDEAKVTAHTHPVLSAIWRKIGEICDFPGLKDLSEAHKPFPDFNVLNIN